MSDYTLEVSRVIDAPITKVWRAWTDPVEMVKWYAPEQLTTPKAEVDLTVGGAYRVVMKGQDGEHVAVGTFTAIEEPSTLSFTWKWEGSPEAETMVTITLEKVSAESTKVTLRHTGFTDEKSKEVHAQGWESTYNKLETYVS